MTAVKVRQLVNERRVFALLGMACVQHHLIAKRYADVVRGRTFVEKDLETAPIFGFTDLAGALRARAALADLDAVAAGILYRARQLLANVAAPDFEGLLYFRWQRRSVWLRFGIADVEDGHHRSHGPQNDEWSRIRFNAAEILMPPARCRSNVRCARHLNVYEHRVEWRVEAETGHEFKKTPVRVGRIIELG